MDLGRKVDERLWLLKPGKIPFVVSGQGQEATQIGMAYAMKEEIFHLHIMRFSICYFYGDFPI